MLCTVNNFPHYRMTTDIEAPQDEINTLGFSRTLRQIRHSQTYHVMNGERYSTYQKCINKVAPFPLKGFYTQNSHLMDSELHLLKKKNECP